MTTAPSSSIAPSSDDDIGHWNFEFHPLPRHNNNDITATSSSHHHHVHQHANTVEMIVCISIPLHQLFAHDEDAYRAFVPHSSDSQSLYDDDNNDGEIIMRQASAAKVALADYTARCIADLLPIHSTTNNTSDSNMMNDDSDANSSIIIQTMGQQSRKHQHHRHHNTNTIGRRAGRQNCHAGSKNLKKKRVAKRELPIPFVLERTDCMIVQMPQSHLQPQHTTSAAENSSSTTTPTLQFYLHASIIKSSSASSWDDRKIRMLLLPELHPLYSRLTSYNCYQHVACVVLQRMLRSMLLPPRWQSRQEQNLSTTSKQKQQEKPYYLNAIAFIADGSLLPRKSGRSLLPMPSPPSLPFVSPHQQGENDSISTDSSQLTRIVTVNVGKFWRRYLNDDGSTDSRNLDQHSKANTELPTTSSTTTIGSKTVTMRGMIIPRGVTLIVGGGYHGKSTLLHQALVMGVYDTVPGDGRERCVSHADAVSIRAEDGRYVNNVNISAFISELPKIKSWGRSSTSATTEAATSTSSISTSSSLSDTGNYSRRGDVTCFGTKDASGSTSQAANVIEAIECGASALLVDEDVSAANFMARDGRMRAMIMNEPITPLLYRVNGLFLTKGISTVVVVGGVGDWLDVADAVVLMQDYVAYDGLKKARSVSYQFSYGHVQYAGRGVVHRLPWEVKESGQKEKSTMEEEPTSAVSTLSPLRRRPEPLTNKFNDVAMLDSSSSRLWFYEASDGKSGHDDNSDTNQESSAGDDDNNDDDEDEGIVDMSKCSQLIENASEQLYGCGICVLWLIQEAQRHPGDDLLDLLIRMDRELDFGGMNKLLLSLEESRTFVNDDAVASATTTIPNLLRSSFALDLWETVGCAYRPRRHEVAMALTRLRGIKFEILPEKQNESESMSSEEKAKLLEEESKKRTLAELWENRRRK
ncbi:hypothetical protein ACHAWU_004421 [Discostella pseudostelligera]|uniref:ATPase of the ABC class C-terminal domain-containing protein n=1 Tax=Discostella pseudostelligera TaxID=259834 RepID=A0ABD3NB96_9STRA